MQKLSYLITLLILLIFKVASADTNIINGDAQFAKYLPILKNKKVAVFANSASLVNNTNIVDSLIAKQINIVKIFSPEHGFSGLNDAGAKIKDSNYKHKISIISLYGKKLAPNNMDLKDVDIIIFDIQDVGVRYYTYISSLQKLLEAAINNNKPLILLDRANPNSFYIDGPVLNLKYKSFVGMQPIPIVYGMTIGEYAQMLVGEKWLDITPKSRINKLQLTIIPVANYIHQNKYQPLQKPSPNLPNLNSIYWYPSLGWFEGTKVSIGRGTPMPFQVLGAPEYKATQNFSFLPKALSGAQNPPYKEIRCYGWDLQMAPESALQQINGQIRLDYLLNAYQKYPDKQKFFTSFFNKLAGNSLLQQQIKAGLTEQEIRASWQKDLNAFKKTRKKYLLYQD